MEKDRLEIIRLEEKFKDVPLEEDTAILYAHFGKIGGFDVKFEFWVFETYAGVCAIFLKEDIAALSREEVIALVKKDCGVEKVDLSRTESQFLFANYSVRDHSR